MAKKTPEQMISAAIDGLVESANEQAAGLQGVAENIEMFKALPAEQRARLVEPLERLRAAVETVLTALA